MRTLERIDTSARSREGWVALPLLIKGLEDGQRVAVQTAQGRYIVGHVVRTSIRWWLVPDWRVGNKNDLPLYDVS